MLYCICISVVTRIEAFLEIEPRAYPTTSAIALTSESIASTSGISVASRGQYVPMSVQPRMMALAPAVFAENDLPL